MIPLFGLRLFALAIAGLGILLVAYTLAAAPSRVASRLGMRGLMRRKAVQSNAAWGAMEPIVRWMSLRVSGLISEDGRKKIDAQVDLAGAYLGLTAEEYVALSILASILGGIFGAVFGFFLASIPLFTFLGFGLGGVMPYLQISGEAQRRLTEINEGLPYAIDLMALSMSAGLDFPGAIRQVVEKSSNPDDALIVEFTRMLQELQLGRTRQQVLRDLSLRAPTSVVTEFAASLIQAEQRGNPVADVLQIQAGVARMRRSTRSEEAAAKAAVRMVGPLFMLFGCIMLLIVGPMALTLTNIKL